MEITLKNYRAFSGDHPLKIKIEDGITALVGPNNAGKSFVLKSFYELRPLFDQLKQNQNFVLGQRFTTSFNANHPLELFYKHNTESLEIILNFEKFKLFISFNRGEIIRTQPALFIGGIQQSITELKQKNLIEFRESEVWDVNENKSIGNIAELFTSLEMLTTACYFPAFRNAVNIGAQQPYYDIQIGDAFIQAWHAFSTSNDPRLRKKARQVQNDLKELFGYSNLQIHNAAPPENKLIVDINDESYLLSDLGSGIAQFILVFINAAVKEPSFILIDEPELNLHPKLQIDFINRLLPYSKNGIIFATHNLGLAHSVASRIYSVVKGRNESLIKPFEVTPKNFYEFLGEMNFSNFPSLGFRKVLLTEGPNDMQVFAIFLRKLQKYQDVMLWLLGGDSMISGETAQQLAELKRLGKRVKIFGWIDSERKTKGGRAKKDREEFQSKCRNLGISIRISDRKSIENYFPIRAIKAVNPKIESLGPYDSLPPEWDKGSNWRIAQETDIKEIEDTDLYNFFQQL